MSKKLYDENGNVVEGVKVKKPFYKKWWFIALVVVIIIGAIGGDDEDNVSTDTSEPEIEEVVAEDVDVVEEEEEPEEIVEEKTEEVEETEVSDSTEEEEQKLIVSLAESIAIENFEGVAEVHYSEEENAMVFLPIDEDFTMALAMVESGLLDKSSWHSLRDNFVEYSGILSEFTGDESILVYMANPANPDRYILVANNGQVIYDVFE